MNEITCPYCKTEDCYGEPWELEPEEDHTIECNSCEKEFICTPEVHIEYTSTRIECADGSHEFDEWRRFDYDEKYLNASEYSKDEEPYSLWGRNCANCDCFEIERVEFKADLPEHLKEKP